MPDVEVSIGGNLSPLQKSFAQIKEQAKEAGEKAGFEFGNRTAYMAEQRVHMGMQQVIRSLATAEDPISAISGAVEGLGRSFRIASGAFLGLAIGDFIREQLTKAAESASEYFDKVGDAMGKNVNAMGKEQIDSLQKELEDASKQYEKRGLFEKMLFGASEDQAQHAVEKFLEEVKKKGDELAARLTRDEIGKRSNDSHVREAAEVDETEEEYKAKIATANDRGEVENAKALAEDREDAIDKIHQKYQRERDQARDEAIKKSEEDSAKEWQRQERLNAEYEKQDQLRREMGAKTSQDRIDNIQAEIAAKQKDIDGATDEVSKQKAITEQLQLQKALGEAQDDQLRARQRLYGEVWQKMIEQSEASRDLQAARAQALIFRGDVSSLQRIGGGGRVGVNHSESQLKAAQETNLKLERIEAALQALNGKFDVL